MTIDEEIEYIQKKLKKRFHAFRGVQESRLKALKILKKELKRDRDKAKKNGRDIDKI